MTKRLDQIIAFCLGALAVFALFAFRPQPTVVKGYEEPTDMYLAPDGLWYPEPTLADP